MPLSVVSSVRLALVAITSAVLLSACGADTWFGSDDKAPLEGERIAILQKSHKLDAKGNATAEIRLPAPEPNDDWPQAGGYSHHAMQHMVLAKTPTKIWSSSAGAGSSKRNRLLSEPIIAAGRVFVVDSEATVSSFDLKSGKQYWSVDTTPDYEGSEALRGGGIGYADGKVFVTTGFAEVIALEANTGKELWRRNVTAPIHAAPTINGGRVFIVTIDNKALALAADDGRILWTHPGGEQSASILTNASPAVDNGVVVVPFSSGEVAALRVDSGAELWSDAVVAARRTDAVGILADIGSRPVIDGNRVFVVSHSGLLAGIDMRSGNRAWEQQIASLDTLWIAGNVLYVLTTEEQLVALDSRTGETLWVTELPKYEDPEDKSGRIMWAGPVLVSDRLIITASTGEALSVNPYNGEILGRIELPGPVSLAPAVANETLVFLTDEGDVVAYR